MTDFSKYRTAIMLDTAFHAALVRAFGEKAAGDRRYDYNRTDWPDYLKKAHSQWREASNIWMEEIQSKAKGYGFDDTPSAKRREG